MSTSGTNLWRPDIETVIVEGYERCEVDAQILTGYQARAARRSLNLMFADWATRGINYWKTSEKTLDLVKSQIVYQLPEGTLDILSAVMRRSDTDTDMERISLTDYNALPTKSSEGLPTTYFFDRQYIPQIYLWLVPENSTDKFIYWSLDQIQDVAGSDEDPDVPYRWNDALCAGLAARLSTKIKGLPAQKRLELKADAIEAFDHVGGDEGERATFRIIPTSIL